MKAPALKKIALKDATPLEHHLVHRINWLRAAVLGANDGILSTASLVSGVAASGAGHGTILLAGIAGLAAGATSMAAGEYVSVSSQSDIETSDLAAEKRELKRNPAHELEELTQIYVGRGLEQDLAKKVAEQLTAHDALGAHARDELGLSHTTAAKPVQAALASGASFTGGAVLPLLVSFFAPHAIVTEAIIVSALVSLVVLGALGAKLSGMAALKPTLRVFIWGALALGLTTLIGAYFKVPV